MGAEKKLGMQWEGTDLKKDLMEETRNGDPF